MNDERLLDIIKREMKLFGSRAYGNPNNESDWDYACSTEVFEELIEFLKFNKIIYKKNKNYTKKFKEIKENTINNEENIKFTLSDKEINVVSFSNNKIETVFEIIDSLIAFSEDGTLISRKFRENKNTRIQIVVLFFKEGFDLKKNKPNRFFEKN